MTDLEGSQDLFWHMWFERGAGKEGFNGRLITHDSVATSFSVLF